MDNLILTKMTATNQPQGSKYDYRSALVDLGYHLTDFGKYWRTSANYRGGDNNTALKIYKNTGVWSDFTKGSESFPFERLVTLSAGSVNQAKALLSKYELDERLEFEKRELIEMDTVYSEEILEKLFPNFKLYNDKRISNATMSKFNCGYASSGKMYRRIVFPIYNEHQQIIGFTGRRIDDSVSNEDSPKWKHIGKKRNWVFPSRCPKYNCEIEEKSEAILVESVGDCLALVESGVNNSLVTFGIGVSSSVIAFLIEKGVRNIIIAGNNDFDSKENHGVKGMVKIFLDLVQYFDVSNIKMKLPPEGHNDLSKAHEYGILIREWNNSGRSYEALDFCLRFARKYPNLFSAKEINKLKKLQNVTNQ